MALHNPGWTRGRLPSCSQKRLQSVPTPIHPMMRDKTILDLHHFQDIGLISIRCFSWVFPNKLMTVREICAGTMPLVCTSTDLAINRLKEGSNLSSPLHNALTLP